MTIGVLCSGGLGFELLKKIAMKYTVAVVLTDKGSTSIIEFCDQHRIPFYAGNPRGGKGYSFIKNYPVDAITSVNYLFLIEEDIYAHATKLSFNVHGSLLPKYRGRTPHVWAIINNELETGVTAHRIDNGCDTGDVISQIKVPIQSTDTGNDILIKFRQVYPDIVFDVLDKLQNGVIAFTPQDHSLATYFGKRTPADGRINWEWQRERIYNWVRAQSAPYPGAYTYCGERKVIIHRVKLSEHGFHYETPNGTIVAVNDGHPVVKTPNGCIELTTFETDLLIEPNQVLK